MNTSLPTGGNSQSFAGLLCKLRWVGVAGQAATIVIVTGPMGVQLDPRPLWAGVALLTLFNVYVTFRVRRRNEMRPAELFSHLCVDIAVLAWLVAWSGGLENPFASLFLLPIALSILALPTTWVWAAAAASLVGFTLAVLLGIPLPHVHSFMGDTFNLHKAGMLVSFLVSAAVVLVFLLRMAALWRARERELALLRERFARNEGIVALATHAAAVAHELNTPLATLTLMVDEIAAEKNVSAEDTATMRTIIGQCRDRVRALAAPALEGQGENNFGTAAVSLEEVIDRWQLVRPTIELRRGGSLAGRDRVDAGIGHLLRALLNNAADASEQAGSTHVDLNLESDGRALSGEIRDYGLGFDQAAPRLPGTLFSSGKPGGLGLGLALSHATVERLGGELSLQPVDAGRGVRVTFRIPTSAPA